MKRVFAAACCLMFLPLSALAREKNTPATPMTDQQFVDLAAQTDMLEAHLSQMAQNQAAGQDVKNYAETLVTDPTKDYQQLSAMSAKDPFAVPKGLDWASDKTIEPFEKLKGNAFDNRYLRETIVSYSKAIDVFTRESKDAQNSDLKNYAAAALPTLNKQLDSARELEKKLDK